MKTQPEMNKNELKQINEIDFPFRMKLRTPIFKIATAEPPTKKKHYFKEPIALIIKSNYEVKILENVKEGFIELDKKIGKNIETVRIFNPKSKLLSFPIGNTVYRGWILDENEAVALPTKTTHDSLVLKRMIEALVLNYEEFKTKQMRVWLKYALWFIIVIAVLIGFMAVMGISFADVLGTNAPQQAGQTINYIIDSNSIGQGLQAI